MKRILILLFAAFVSNYGFGQDFQADFQNYIQSGDTLSQLKVLKSWEAASPTDPELFTSYFNYYFMKSRHEVITLTKEKSGGNDFTLQDSTGQTAGYLGSTIRYDIEELQKAFKAIDEGIKLQPNRLDMRFGKIYALGQTEDWEGFTNEIIQAVDISSKNKNLWLWTNNKNVEDGEKFFLSSIQDYQVQLYETGDDRLLENMRNIANEILKYYPNHIESLSNLSITYLIQGEFDKGIAPLLKAEKLNPKDHIVLLNIAQGYKLKGDKNNAIAYYKKAIKYGDPQTEEEAKRQIESLSK